MTKIVIDARHGGNDTGAVYRERLEKNDNLRLAIAVGQILQSMNMDVLYTRTEDVDQTIAEKAALVNESEADYLLSLQRNSSTEPNQFSGVEAQVYDHSGIKETMAENVVKKLEEVGFHNLGVQKFPKNAILRKINLSAIALAAGCINSDVDNQLFDSCFNDMAMAIAKGILETLENQASGQQIEDNIQDEIFDETESSEIESKISYRVQTGTFKVSANAENLLYHLQKEGFPAYIVYEGDYFKVQVGIFRKLDDAIRMESMLRCCGYSTFLTM